MTDSNSTSGGFRQPPVVRNANGDIRNVGFELEYAGVDLRDSVKLLEILLACTAKEDNAFRYRLCDHDDREWRIEIDAALLHEGSYKQYLAAAGMDTDDLRLERKIDDLIESLASVVVPCEIVSPPLPLDAMGIIEDIVVGLRRRHARGTGHSLLYAFGLHINAEVAATDPDYLLRHMRAFALLYDWICRDSKVDFSRKLSTYIKPWPPAYLKRLLDTDYSPDADALLGDYLREVGSRNHALDMLPVFATLDADKVQALAREPDLVKPRPAFHYRLPNSRIDQSEWCVAAEWNYWVRVEVLAADRERLHALCRDYIAQNQASFLKPGAFWATHVARVLQLDDG